MARAAASSSSSMICAARFSASAKYFLCSALCGSLMVSSISISMMSSSSIHSSLRNPAESAARAARGTTTPSVRGASSAGARNRGVLAAECSAGMPPRTRPRRCRSLRCPVLRPPYSATRASSCSLSDSAACPMMRRFSVSLLLLEGGPPCGRAGMAKPSVSSCGCRGVVAVPVTVGGLFDGPASAAAVVAAAAAVAAVAAAAAAAAIVAATAVTPRFSSLAGVPSLSSWRFRLPARRRSLSRSWYSARFL